MIQDVRAYALPRRTMQVCREDVRTAGNQQGISSRFVLGNKEEEDIHPPVGTKRSGL